MLNARGVIIMANSKAKPENATRTVRARCRGNIERFDIGYSNQIMLAYGLNHLLPEVFSYKVGQINTFGKLISFIEKDKKNGNTAILEELIKESWVLKLNKKVKNKDEEVVNIYVPYDILEHPARKPSARNIDMKEGKEYYVLCEFLFDAGDAKRYVYFPYTSDGSKPYSPADLFIENDWQEDIMDWLDKDGVGIGYSGDYLVIDFFDDAGNVCKYEFERDNSFIELFSGFRIIEIRELSGDKE